MKTWLRTALLLAAIAIAFAFLAWRCSRDPRINFLPKRGGADWIIFPRAIDTGTHPIVNLDTRFRRTFDLPVAPPAASLQLRAARRIELKVNGTPIDLPARANWKDVSAIDVTGALRAGANTMEARVYNNSGPPALWLTLRAGDVRLGTDGTWESSFTGSSWRPAVPAAIPRFPGPGNLAAGGEQMSDAVKKIWPVWLLLALAGAALLAGFQWWRRRQAEKGSRTPEIQFVLLGLITVLWVALFWNNARQLPFATGFDVQPHLDYIKYLQEKKTLPSPNEGFEMYQPPLYYLLAAAALSLGGTSVDQTSGIMVLRVLNMLCGMAHFLLVFLTLRLLFPRRAGPQIAGLLIAAFLPLQIYMSHYLTNETLAATLVAAALYLSLRLLRQEEVTPARYALLGLFLGAALLTKATALLLIPLLALAFAIRLIRSRAPAGAWWRGPGTTMAVCLFVCGWNYLRVWRRFGNPLLGNWDVTSGFSWWQDPGYHTTADYFRFGRSLGHPFFSSLAGFWDGIYSTLWGDGLWGGMSDFASRTPWNYQLVTGGFLLALVPILLVGAGLAWAIRGYLRQPKLERFVLLGYPVLILSGIGFMTLKIPAYAQVKAIYGLSAVIPLCALAAFGWVGLTDRRPRLRFALGLMLFVWTANSFASLWIRPTASRHVYSATRLRSAHHPDKARAEALLAVAANPADSAAHRCLSLIEQDENRDAQALAEARRAVELAPRDSAAHLQLGALVAKEGQSEEAMAAARRALEFGRENAAAYGVLLPRLIELRQTDEAIKVAQDSLQVIPFSPEVHYLLGLAAGRAGQFDVASDQFAYALLLRPDWEDARAKLRFAVIGLARTEQGTKYLPETISLAAESPVILNDLAWLFATHPDSAVRRATEAVRLAEQACALAGDRKNATLLTTVAAAYAEAGRFDEAVARAEEARQVARAAGNESMAALSEELAASFRAMQPYRQSPDQP